MPAAGTSNWAQSEPTLQGSPAASYEVPSSARIVEEKGTLWVESLVLEGVDALKMFFAPGRLALRYSGRRDELRYVL